MMGLMTARDGSGRDRSDPTNGADGLWERAAAAFTAWYDGRPEAMNELVALMTPVLWQIARAARLSADDASDAVQATWLALVQHAGSIADARAVPAWLITTVRRESVGRSRRATRHADVDDTALEPLLPAAAPTDDVVVDRDEHRRLWAAVGTLTARCQELLRVVAFAERPDYAALAGRLGMRVGSIGPTRGRCLEKLRASLAMEAVT